MAAHTPVWCSFCNKFRNFLMEENQEENFILNFSLKKILDFFTKI